MQHEMDVTAGEDELFSTDPDTSVAEEQVCSPDDPNPLPSQDGVLRPRRKHPRLDNLRPWKSLPATPSEELEKDQPVFFSSLTSLQAEEFFDMVARVQARRLNDQRADFSEPEEVAAEASGVSEDQLYDTILSHQSKRLEDQRTEPPIPVGIQGLLDLLLRAQGTRMEDQRSTLPPASTVASFPR